MKTCGGCTLCCKLMAIEELMTIGDKRKYFTIDPVRAKEVGRW